jgi:hypothetical protein
MFLFRSSDKQDVKENFLYRLRDKAFYLVEYNTAQ